MCIRLHLLHTSALYDTYSVASVSALYDSDDDGGDDSMEGGGYYSDEG